MKLLTGLLTFSMLWCGLADAQNYVTEQQYAAMKANGTLAPNTMVQPGTSTVTQTNSKPLPTATAKSGCQCYIPPDASYTLASFTSCDDGFVGPIPLPFTFCLYGTNYTDFYINTNGNITFGAPYTAFSATGFPSGSFAMLAPFWGDVDLCGTGQVWYKVTADVVYVNWVQVGYYPSQTNR